MVIWIKKSCHGPTPALGIYHSTRPNGMSSRDNSVTVNVESHTRILYMLLTKWHVKGSLSLLFLTKPAFIDQRRPADLRAHFRLCTRHQRQESSTGPRTQTEAAGLVDDGSSILETETCGCQLEDCNGRLSAHRRHGCVCRMRCKCFIFNFANAIGRPSSVSISV